MGYGDYQEALGKEYHIECFVCFYCKKGFPDSKFFTHEDHLCHEKCIPKSSAKEGPAEKRTCKECGHVIAPGTEFYRIKYTGDTEARDYHLRCVKCKECGKLIGLGKHAISHDQPVHIGCMHGAEQTKGPAQEFSEELKCTACGEQIRGRKKEVPEFGSFHLTCFKCCKCNLGITGEIYYKDPATGKARCHRCPP
jgi:hypothetical protein